MTSLVGRRSLRQISGRRVVLVIAQNAALTLRSSVPAANAEQIKPPDHLPWFGLTTP